MKTNETTKKFRKKILLVLGATLAAVAIAVSSVLATVAYLTASSAVSNVFSIGKVGITMTETKVDNDGHKLASGEQVDTNTYLLIPNTTYDKDPRITVLPESIDSYLFVLVRNDIEAIECKDHPEHKTIAEQLATNGWAKYSKASTGWIYVYVGTEVDSVADAGRASDYVYTGSAAKVTPNEYKLFDTFSIDAHADVSAYGAAKVTLTAYAIQDEGFTTIADAWAAILATYPYIHTGSNG